MDDREAREALGALIQRATAKRLDHVDPSHMSSIKTLCRASDRYVESAFDLLYQRLKHPHSQVRLLALEVCDELFGRSKHFRALLTGRLTHFLELVVGHKSENPLPPPAPAAVALRAKALEVLERWQGQFGAKYKQVALGYDYLKNTLRLPFPDAQSAAAQQEQARRERQAAAQQRLQERYGQLCEEQGAASREFKSFLDQMAECFAVLAEEQQQQQQQQQQQRQQHERPKPGGGTPSIDKRAGSDEEGMEWEDVAAPPATGELVAGQLPSDDGLPGYAAGLLAEQAVTIVPPDGAGDSGGAVAPQQPKQLQPESAPQGSAAALAAAAAGDEAVWETLTGVYRLVLSQALPAVQEWLHVLTGVDLSAQDPTQQQQRDQLLTQATDLHTLLNEARSHYEEVAAQVALLNAEQRQAAARVTLDDLFGRDSDDEQEEEGVAAAGVTAQLHATSGTGGEDAADKEREGIEVGHGQGQQPQGQQADSGQPSLAVQQGQQGQQQKGLPPERQRQRHGTSARQPQGRNSAQHLAQRQQQAGELHNPYDSFLDPAAPRKPPAAAASTRPAGSSPSQDDVRASRAAAAAAGLSGRQPRQPQQGGAAIGSSLPESVKKALAEQAPVLPGGLYTHYWDTNSAPVYVSGHGLEVSNHWGPVDVHAELPPERVEELFMHSYTVPARHQQQPQQDGQHQQDQQQPASEGEQQQDRPSAQPGRHLEPPSGTLHALEHDQPNRRGPVGGSGGSTSQIVARQPPDTLGLAELGGGEEDRAIKRARRAVERAYNDALIGGRDEQRALELHQTELAKLLASRQRGTEQQQDGTASPVKKTKKPKLTVRERLAKKLLRKGADAALRDMAAVDDEKQRDKFGSRWENK